MPAKLKTEYILGETHFMLRIPRYTGEAAIALLDIELYALVKSMRWTYNSGMFVSSRGITLLSLVANHFDKLGGRKEDNADFTVDNLLASRMPESYAHIVKYGKLKAEQSMLLSLARHTYIKGNGSDVVTLSVIVAGVPTPVKVNRRDMRLIPLRAGLGRHGITYIKPDGTAGRPVMNKIIAANEMPVFAKVALSDLLDLTHSDGCFNKAMGNYVKLVDDGESEFAAIRIYFESEVDSVELSDVITLGNYDGQYCISALFDANLSQEVAKYKWTYNINDRDIVAKVEEYSASGEYGLVSVRLKRVLAQLYGKIIEDVYVAPTPTKRYVEASENPSSKNNAKYLSKIHSANSASIKGHKPFKPAKIIKHKQVHCMKTTNLLGFPCIDMREQSMWIN